MYSIIFFSVFRLTSVEETHRACLEIRDEQKGVIRDLKNELSACEKNYEMLHQEYDELNVRLVYVLVFFLVKNDFNFFFNKK